MKSKNIWKYGFNWGSIVGGAFFLYHVFGFLFKIETNFLWSFLGTFVVVFGMGWAMVNYRKNVMKMNLKFGKLFSIGAIMSIFISLFLSLFMVIYIAKLNPTYLDGFLIQYQDILDQMGSEIDAFDPLIIKTIKAVLIPSIYIFDYIGNLFYVLILTLVLSRPTLANQINRNSPNPNDYVPYQDLKKEEENEIESEDVVDEKDEEDVSNQQDEREDDDVHETGEIESSKKNNNLK